MHTNATNPILLRSPRFCGIKFILPSLRFAYVSRFLFLQSQKNERSRDRCHRDVTNVNVGFMVGFGWRYREHGKSWACTIAACDGVTLYAVRFDMEILFSKLVETCFRNVIVLIRGVAPVIDGVLLFTLFREQLISEVYSLNKWCERIVKLFHGFFFF